MMRILLVVIYTVLYAVSAFGFGKGVEGCTGDCTACHKVTRGEVQEIFKNLDPTVTVEDVAPSPARGLYQVTLKKGASVQVIYLDFSKNYLIAGQLVDIRSKSDLTRQSVESATTVDVTGLPLKNALVMGNTRGKKELYLFSDPECPYCANLHKTIGELVKEEPELKVYIFLIPLDVHPNSLWKTDAIMCKAKENRTAALRMLENSYHGKEVPRQSCGVSLGAKNKELGTKLGVTVTPTIAFKNGRVFMGARSKEDIRNMLNGTPEGK